MRHRIDSLHAELGWVHLAAHVAARALLASEQLAAYQRLRSAPGSRARRRNLDSRQRVQPSTGTG